MQENLLRKRVVQKSPNFKFLLDENVSNNLKKRLIILGHDVVTVQELNKRGTKNNELMELARIKNRILITYDKDFIFFKHKKEDFIIFIDIHPLIDENVIPVFEEYIKSLNYDDLKNNLIIIANDSITLKKKI